MGELKKQEKLFKVSQNCLFEICFENGNHVILEFMKFSSSSYPLEKKKKNIEKCIQIQNTLVIVHSEKHNG